MTLRSILKEHPVTHSQEIHGFALAGAPCHDQGWTIDVHSPAVFDGEASKEEEIQAPPNCGSEVDTFQLESMEIIQNAARFLKQFTICASTEIGWRCIDDESPAFTLMALTRRNCPQLLDELAAVAMQALRQFTQEHQSIHLLGSHVSPFKPTQQGFTAVLARLPPFGRRCNRLYLGGFCAKGKRCNRRHPTCSALLDVVIVSADQRRLQPQVQLQWEPREKQTQNAEQGTAAQEVSATVEDHMLVMAGLPCRGLGWQ